MTSVELLRSQAELAFESFLASVEGVTQELAWAVLPAAGEEYLHTDGSIYSIVLHVASGKMMYGSIGFRDNEIRWRDIADRFDAFEPDWEAALLFLKEAHAYWMGAWADLTDEDLDTERLRFSQMWPTSKIIDTVTQHDSYHAGQIAVLRYANMESQTPPLHYAEDIRTHCAEMPSW